VSRPVHIFHITTGHEVDAACSRGEYVPDAFAREGFIHCSHPHQVMAVANRLFRGRSDVVLLEIDPARLPCRVVEENLEGGAERYPHIYGRLPMAAVVAVLPLRCGADGQFT
jgi:uncharacterized protein (DUF952 family)